MSEAPRGKKEALLPKLAVDRPVAVLVVFLAAVVVGVVAFMGLEVELLPRGFESPYLYVVVPWRDSPAEEVLDKITLPLEEELSTVKGMQSITSISATGRSAVYLIFKQGTSIKVAYREVRDRVERAKRLFPDDVDQVLVRNEDPASLPAYVGSIVIDPAIEDPYEMIDRDIVTPISRLPGVASVRFTGLEQKVVAIDLDRSRTEAAGLDIYRVSQIMSSDNFAMTNGNVREAGQKLLVRTVARYQTLDDYRSVRLKPTVTLGDIGTVRLGTVEDETSVRSMGKPATGLVVMKEGSANAREVSARIAETLAAIERDPQLGDTEFVRLFSQHEIIDESLTALLNSGAVGSVIAAAVLLFFLRRVRLTIVVLSAIPLSIFISLAVMFFVGETLNMLSILGLMFCVGLLVDNSVVVAENIFRYHRSGYSRRDAAIHGTSEMTLAITMSTLTTIVVFVPALLVEGPNRFFLQRLAIPVSVSLLASLLVALVFIPLVVYVNLGGSRFRTAGDRGSGDLDDTGGALARFFDNSYDATFGVASRGYQRALAWALENRLPFTLAVGAIFVLSLIGVREELVRFVGIGRFEDSGLNLNVQMPDGTTFEEAQDWFFSVERVVEENADRLGIDGWIVNHRRMTGEIRAWYSSDREGLPTARQASEQIRALLPERPGMKVFSREESQISSDAGEDVFQVRLFGEDPRLLEETALSLEDALLRLPGVVAARKSSDQQPNELGLMIDRARARKYGANPRVVAGLVGYALRGTMLRKFGRENREVAVLLRYQEKDRDSLEKLKSFRIPTDAGDTISLGSVTDEKLLSAPVQILRFDKKMSRTLSLELTEGRERQTRSELVQRIADIDLPEGVTYSTETAQTGRRQELKEVGLAVRVSTILIYLLMGFLFESVVLPLSILFTIPLAFIGVFGLHLGLGRDINLLGAIGFVILVGIVVNNGIVLVDYLHRLRERGHARFEAIMLATEHRFRPIMMTAITTIGGLIPLAFTGEDSFGLSYDSFALTLIGGMTAATALTLLVVPVFYTFIDDARSSVSRALLGKRAAKPSAPTPAPSSPPAQ